MAVFSNKEIKECVHLLQPTVPELLGLEEWLKQHSRIVKLTVQAVQETTLSTESLHEHFVQSNKVQLLVNEILCVEQWRNVVFENIPLAMQEKCAVKAYAMWYHETCASKLLEIMAFHKDVCQSLENTVVDLIDYCFRSLSGILQTKKSNESSKTQAFEDLIIGNATSSLSILRYIASYQEDLPEAVSSRMLRTIDVPVLVSQVIQHPFWVRSTSKGVEIYENGLWRKSRKDEDDEDFQLHPLEGQAWVLLLQLLTGNCSYKYEVTESRKRELTKLQRHLTVLKIDQLPALKILQKAFTHWNFDSEFLKYGKSQKRNPIVLEAIPELCNSMTNYFNANKEALRDNFLKSCLTGDCNQRFLDNLASLYLLDELGSLSPKLKPETSQSNSAQPVNSNRQTVCVVCSSKASYRCSQCRKEYYCGRKCQESHWQQHQPRCSKSVPKFIDFHV